MAQHDYVIANGTGAAVRSDLNNALAAIVSNNSGATEPATMYAYQWWADTSTGLLKLRNAANNAWITLRELDGTLTIEDGTASSPGLAFADDLNTGIYSPSADQLGITTGGTVRLTTTTTGITSALPVDVPLGTASAPTVTFTGDLNTGIYSPGADQVAISTNGSGRLFVDASGRVLVGTSTSRNVASGGPSIVQIEDSSFRHLSMVQNSNDDNGVTLAFGKSRGTSAGGTTIVQNNDDIANIRFAGANGSDVATVAAQIRVQVDGTPGTTNDMPGRITFWTTADASGSPTERMRITSAGNVGIGTTSPSRLLHLSAADSTSFSSADFDQTYNFLRIVNTTNDKAAGIYFGIGTNGEAAITAAETTDGETALVFGTRGGGARSERARLDHAGRLLVGTSSALAAGGSLTPVFQIAGGDQNSCTQMIRGGGSLNPTLVFARSNGSIASPTAVVNNNGVGGIIFEGYDGTNMVRAAIIAAEVDGTPGTNDMPGKLVFSTTKDGQASPTEACRIDSSQNFHVGRTSGGSGNGCSLEAAGIASINRSGGTPCFFNRNTNDGVIVSLQQDGAEEGSISVSGTTVSYNGAHLSRWSQLPGGAEREKILRGSVLSNINEMCEWGEEDNEQLNRMKVSDVEGDKNVSGVFQCWDDDDDTYTNDFYCAMTGDFIIRIAQGVTVERGDLLMSAGDGTAKPQDDDIIRSKTIAKVTSATVSCTYEDGSYCVPCVLMAC